MLSYYANGKTAGMTDMSYDDVMAFCEEICGHDAWMMPSSCDDIQYQDLKDDALCHRTSSHGYIDVGDE